jgi:hypothetical protein
MAKKKNKKIVQKQVDVVSPPDDVEPTTAPVAEEPTLKEATEPPIQPLEATVDEALTEESSLMLDPNHEKPRQASFDVSTPLETHHDEEAAPTTADMGTTSSTELEKDASPEETEPSVLQRIHSPVTVPEEPSQLKPSDTESQRGLSDASEEPAPPHLSDVRDDHSKHEPEENHPAGLQPDLSFPEEPPPATTEDSTDIVGSPNVEPQTFAAATEDTSDMIEPAAMEATSLKYDERYVWP